MNKLYEEHLLGTHIYTNDGSYDDNVDYININCTFYINSTTSFEMSSGISNKLCSDFEEFIKTKYRLKDIDPAELS